MPSQLIFLLINVKGINIDCDFKQHKRIKITCPNIMLIMPTTQNLIITETSEIQHLITVTNK